MNEIRLIGQAITSVDYTAERLFNMNPGPLKEAAENFLASGITEIEIPQAFLDPEGRCADTGLDKEALKELLDGLPEETKVLGMYLGPGSIGEDNEAFLEASERTLDHMTGNIPAACYTMLHPPHIDDMTGDDIKAVVDTWAELAKRMAEKLPGFQCCLHNHYDGSCETAEQVRTYLSALENANEPALRWGPDTGHCHGMGEGYLQVFNEYAHLIGNHFHIKARIAAFDQMHGGDEYRADRDIWGNKAERGRGLYSGFVCCADPEMQTPLKEVFAIIKEKAQPTDGVITGAIEIDIPRQHPILEIMQSVLYLKHVHGLATAQDLSCAEIMDKVWK